MSEQRPVSLRERMGVIRRCRGKLILFVASAMLSSLALSYGFSERYRASTTIMYRPSRRIQIKPEFTVVRETALGFPVPDLPFEVIGKTIERVATSERVLRQVVEDLGLDQGDTERRTGLWYYIHEVKKTVKEYGGKAWQVLKHGRIIETNPTSDAIVGLAGNLQVDSEQNYTAKLTVISNDPQRAATIVDKLADVLVDVMRQLSVQAAREQARDLDDQIQDKDQELKETRKRIEELKTKEGFIALRDEIALHLDTAEQIERDLLKNEQLLGQAGARLKALEAQRKSLEPMIESSETVEDDPLHSKLREMKAQYEVSLRGLLEKLPEQHADVQTLKAKIRVTDELLAAGKPRRVSLVTTQLNSLYQMVHSDELKAQSDIEGLQASNKTLTESLKKVRGRIAAPSVESRLRELELKLQVQELEYRQLVTAREEAGIAEITSVAEIQVLHKATPQDAPFRPIKVYHVALSGFLALMIGIGIAYLADFLGSMWEAPDTGRRRRKGDQTGG